MPVFTSSVTIGISSSISFLVFYVLFSMIFQYQINLLFVRLDSTTRRHFHSALLLLTENPIQNRTLMLLLLLGLAPTRDGPVNSLYLSVCVDIVRYFWKTEAHGQAAPSLFLGPNPIFFVQYPDVRCLYDTFLVYFAVYFFLKCVLLFCFVFGADKSWSSALPPERSNAGVTKT